MIFLPLSSRPKRTNSCLDPRGWYLHAKKYCYLKLTLWMVSGRDSLEARCAFQYAFVSGFVVMICPMITVVDFQNRILYLFLAVISSVMVSMFIKRVAEAPGPEAQL